MGAFALLLVKHVSEPSCCRDQEWSTLLGQTKSIPHSGKFPPCLLFFSVQLFVSNAGIDLWLGEGSYAKQYKLHRLTNIQNAIELSFIFRGVSLNFPRLCYEEVLLWIPPFLNCGTHLRMRIRLCLSKAHIYHWNLFIWMIPHPDELPKPLHAQHLQLMEGFFLWEIRVTDSVPSIPIKSSVILC